MESKNVPDVCILYKKVVDSIGNETSYEWYDYFKENSFEWVRDEKNSSDHGNGKKRNDSSKNSNNNNNGNNNINNDSVNNINNNNDNNNEMDMNSTAEDSIISIPDTIEVKVRYDSAIRSLEKSGIVVRKKGGSIVSREMFAWISDQCL